MQNKNTYIIILLVSIIAVLGLYIILNQPKKVIPKPFETPSQTGDATNPLNDGNEILGETYTYSGHGVTFALQKGFVPTEEQAEGGPYTSIRLPDGYGTLTYIQNLAWWEQYDAKTVYKIVGTEKIGETVFTVYAFIEQIPSTKDQRFYLFKKGNVAYLFSANDKTKKMLETFTFVGWPTAEVNTWKTITRDTYSFEAPVNWNESPVDFNGCDWFNLSNNTGDGHRMAGEVGIYPVDCFNLAAAQGRKETTVKNGYYIIAFYDSSTGTTEAEILETREVHRKIVQTFLVY